MHNLSAKELVDYYHLKPHPEGGYYSETYRCNETIEAGALPPRFHGKRSFSTAIYFLLEQENFSAFHRIKSDECWHFYSGECLHVYVIHPDGELQIIKLGNNINTGESFQAVVPSGCWFASAPAGSYALVGCTVAPGFDFADFVLAEADELAKQYPAHEELIRKLTRK